MANQTATPSLNPQRTALVMIEFQREWLDLEGKLNRMMQDRAQFEGAISGGKSALQAARESGMTVAHVGYSFAPGYPELGKPDYGMDAAIIEYGAFMGKGAEFADGFQPEPAEFVASGRSGVSAFAGSNLDVFLRRHSIDTIVLAGFALQACIESTARNAKDLGYRTYVLEDAVSAFSADQKTYILNQVLWMFAKVIQSGTLKPR